MIGRLAVKLSGREAGKYCVIVEEVNDNFVIIDGNLKRRKCNLSHLELTDNVLNIKKNASTEEVQQAMKKAGINVTVPRKKEKKEVKNNDKRKK